MPVLEVELIGDVAADVRPGMADRIADAVAAVLHAEPQTVWVRLRFTPPSDYAENAGGSGGADLVGAASQGGFPQRPVFVNLLKRTLPSRDDMREEVRALAAAIGAACGRPAENVHIFYEPPGERRVAFGGRLVE